MHLYVSSCSAVEGMGADIKPIKNFHVKIVDIAGKRRAQRWALRSMNSRFLRHCDSAGEYHSHHIRKQAAKLQGHTPSGTSSPASAASTSKGAGASKGANLASVLLVPCLCCRRLIRCRRLKRCYFGKRLTCALPSLRRLRRC